MTGRQPPPRPARRELSLRWWGNAWGLAPLLVFAGAWLVETSATVLAVTVMGQLVIAHLYWLRADMARDHAERQQRWWP